MFPIDGAKVRFARDLSRWKDRLRSYAVVIDGKRAGGIANGETCEFSIEPGQHTLRLKIDWSGSPEVPFELADGETIEFVCRATPLSPLAAIKALVSRTGYIEVEQRS